MKKITNKSSQYFFYFAGVISLILSGILFHLVIKEYMLFTIIAGVCFFISLYFRDKTEEAGRMLFKYYLYAFIFFLFLNGMHFGV